MRKKNEVKKKRNVASSRLGYCPFPVWSHGTVDCIVTQEAWARRGWATIRPRLGLDTVEHAPQYGARVRVAWLAESVAIQRLYHGLGSHLCSNRGSDIGCDTAHDVPRYGAVRA